MTIIDILKPFSDGKWVKCSSIYNYNLGPDNLYAIIFGYVPSISVHYSHVSYYQSLKRVHICCRGHHRQIEIKDAIFPDIAITDDRINDEFVNKVIFIGRMIEKMIVELENPNMYHLDYIMNGHELREIMPHLGVAGTYSDGYHSYIIVGFVKLAYENDKFTLFVHEKPIDIDTSIFGDKDEFLEYVSGTIGIGYSGKISILKRIDEIAVNVVTNFGVIGNTNIKSARNH